MLWFRVGGSRSVLHRQERGFRGFVRQAYSNLNGPRDRDAFDFQEGLRLSSSRRSEWHPARRLEARPRPAARSTHSLRRPTSTISRATSNQLGSQPDASPNAENPSAEAGSSRIASPGPDGEAFNVPQARRNAASPSSSEGRAASSSARASPSPREGRPPGMPNLVARAQFRIQAPSGSRANTDGHFQNMELQASLDVWEALVAIRTARAGREAGNAPRGLRMAELARRIPRGDQRWFLHHSSRSTDNAGDAVSRTLLQYDLIFSRGRK